MRIALRSGLRTLPRARVLLPCWFALLAVGLSACTAPLTPRTTVCEFVRAAVADGSMPLDLAHRMYPECNAVQGTP